MNIVVSVVVCCNSCNWMSNNGRLEEVLMEMAIGGFSAADCIGPIALPELLPNWLSW
jgi:hypothetical protein